MRGWRKAWKRGWQKGIAEGLEKGMAAGERSKALEIARNLLDVLDNATIALKTGLDTADVQGLRGGGYHAPCVWPEPALRRTNQLPFHTTVKKP